MRFHSRIALVLGLVSALHACTPNITARREAAQSLACSNDFSKVLIKSGKFTLTTYQKIKDPKGIVVFYIEGDGFAFVDSNRISHNPTPLRPMLLELATLDNRDNIVYLARPCQYTDLKLDKACTNYYWTCARMSKDIVISITGVIQQIAQNREVSLVGFSGGGGIAILVAPYISKLKNIITIAGNLDIEAFADSHNAIKMSNSFNPLAFVNYVKNIPQIHISGSQDKVVPSLIAQKFTKKIGKCAKHIVVHNATHGNGWSNVWQKFTDINPVCK